MGFLPRLSLIFTFAPNLEINMLLNQIPLSCLALIQQVAPPEPTGKMGPPGPPGLPVDTHVWVLFLAAFLIMGWVFFRSRKQQA